MCSKSDFIVPQFLPSYFSQIRGIIMRNCKFVLVSTLATLCLSASSAFAIDPSYVRSDGSDGAACTLAAPCRTLQKAHDVTDAGGAIYALDATADYGALIITKGITIYPPTGDSSQRPSISVGSGNAVTVNAGSGDTVTLINMQLDGQSAAANGIQFNSGFELRVFGGVMRRFKGAAPNGFGIKFAPAATSKLLVQESTLIGNGTASTGGGVQINPQSGGAAQVLLSHIRSELNAYGVAIDTTGSTNGVNATFPGGEIHANRQDGAIIVGDAPIGLLVNEATIFSNNGNGVRAIGNNVTARLYHSAILGNSTGVVALGGGTVQSYGNNSIDANGVNGTPTPISLK
jgi:hypothetical protein